jgi:hypothetical protein
MERCRDVERGHGDGKELVQKHRQAAILLHRMLVRPLACSAAPALAENGSAEGREGVRTEGRAVQTGREGWGWRGPERTMEAAASRLAGGGGRAGQQRKPTCKRALEGVSEGI